MIKKCPGCKEKKEMRSNQKYCNAKCKKTFENSLRSAPKPGNGNGGFQQVPGTVKRPQHLNETAAGYWDRVAPVVISRGHLNVLSEDAFSELCDIHSRLTDINKAIDETNRSLLQVDDKWDNKAGVETSSFKESALSDLKRKYSRSFLDYCKAFYLTPLSNRGNFGLRQEVKKEKDEFFE